jgi:hypothetical protein
VWNDQTFRLALSTRQSLINRSTKTQMNSDSLRFLNLIWSIENASPNGIYDGGCHEPDWLKKPDVGLISRHGIALNWCTRKVTDENKKSYDFQIYNNLGMTAGWTLIYRMGS